MPAAQALTNLTTANGADVFINDARRPGLDTGSIRNVSGSRLEGFGKCNPPFRTAAEGRRVQIKFYCSWVVFLVIRGRTTVRTRTKPTARTMAASRNTERTPL